MVIPGVIHVKRAIDSVINRIGRVAKEKRVSIPDLGKTCLRCQKLGANHLEVDLY